MHDAVVTISLRPERNQRLHFDCSACTTACAHVGAAFSLILEEKLALGLSAPPPERIPVESHSDKELVKQAIADRVARARSEKMELRSIDSNKLAMAALDPDSEVTAVDLASGMEEMKRRFEVLLGTKPKAPVDERRKRPNRQYK